MWRKGNPLALLVGMQTSAATLENSTEVPQKIKNRITLWPSNCTTRNLSKGYRSAYLKEDMHPNVYSSTINNSQVLERAQMSINWWMDKEDAARIHTHAHTLECYLVTQKNEILPFATTWIEPQCIMLSKISQSEDRHHMISLMCGIWEA